MFIQKLTDEDVICIAKRIYRKLHDARYQNFNELKIEFCHGKEMVPIKIINGEKIDMYILRDFKVGIVGSVMDYVVQDTYKNFMKEKFPREYAKQLKLNKGQEKC